MKSIFFCILLSIIFLTQSLFSLEFYKSSYDTTLSKLDISRSNAIIKLLDDGVYQGIRGSTEAEIKQGLDLAYSAIKRAGELKLYSAKLRVKDVLATINPMDESIKTRTQFAAKVLYVFNISIWTIGKIGDNSDIEFFNKLAPGLLAKENYYGETLYVLINSLGEITNSTNALTLLHEMTKIVNKETLANELIKAILMHNELASISCIVDMKQTRANAFSTNFIATLEYAIDVLTKNGK